MKDLDVCMKLTQSSEMSHVLLRTVNEQDFDTDQTRLGFRKEIFFGLCFASVAGTCSGSTHLLCDI